MTKPDTGGRGEGRMHDDDFDIIITRRMREIRPPLVCVICEQQTEDSNWPYLMRDYDTKPMCGACFRTWSERFRRKSGMTRGDARVLGQVYALTNRINWEIHNGRRA